MPTPRRDPPRFHSKLELSDVLTGLGLAAVLAGAWMRFGLDLALLIDGGLLFGLGVFMIVWSTR